MTASIVTVCKHFINIFSAEKPIVEEVGPYVYKSVTVKDSDDNMKWHDSDGTLTYR